ncbi:MmcQ/YjbR family DNA-binding protein [Devosia sp. WQ 349]|uniref:MmcQ/YjbR family DNA-binding protein n=1 Tax=Devosia sp. WQ 349K1 TaxID=2800329 RepID=UPI001907D664|nr:MmcQ/YjbR family DNA-binding protein [Devosia sp. WQ 349K1]MBK1795306.1 MmcQ/YjbR family DNA-binding protein [Devosia sp. WQ 349K1]
MTMFQREKFDELLGSWPGVTFVDQWDSYIAKVGGKVFCLLSDGSPRIVVKVSEMSFEMLTGLEGISQAPYFAKRAWVQVFDTAPLSEDDLLAYARQSYTLVAKGLTKKLRLELGITDDVGKV